MSFLRMCAVMLVGCASSQPPTAQTPTMVPSLPAAAAGSVKNDDDHTVLGGMTKDPHAEVSDEDQLAIRGVIKAHERDTQACFAKAPDAHGRVEVQFEIAEDGAVAAALTHNTTLHARAVEDCLVGAVKALKFDKPKRDRNVTVTFPFEH